MGRSVDEPERGSIKRWMGSFKAVMDSMIDLEFVPDTQRQLAKTYRSDVERHQTTRFSISILFLGCTPNPIIDISSLIVTSVGGQVLGLGKIFQWHLVGFKRGSVVFLWYWVDCKRCYFQIVSTSNINMILLHTRLALQYGFMY